MDRTVAVGSASGVVSSLAVSFLRALQHSDPSAFFEPVSLAADCLERGATLNFEDFPVGVFLAGVITGILIGPFIDLLWIIKQRWRRFVWSNFSVEPVPQGPGLRLLHELGIY